jgi:hypothetical protein
LLAKAWNPSADAALGNRVLQKHATYRGSTVPFHVLIAVTLSVTKGITTRSVGTINIAACIQRTQTCGTGFSREGISRHNAKPRPPTNL